MKKTNGAALISTAILCFLFWLLITGQIIAIFKGEAAFEVLIAGLIVSLLVGLISGRFFIHERAFYLWNPARLVNLLLYGIIIFPIELFKANWDVAKRAFSKGPKVNPGIVKVPVDVKSDYALSMLADSITLTPGTITMDIAEEDGVTNFYIHWIDVASEDPIEAGKAIKGTLEKWVRRIWE